MAYDYLNSMVALPGRVFFLLRGTRSILRKWSYGVGSNRVYATHAGTGLTVNVVFQKAISTINSICTMIVPFSQKCKQGGFIKYTNIGLKANNTN